MRAVRQQTLASQASFEDFARKNRRELFPDKIEQAAPWGELLALMERRYAKAGNGRQSARLPIMLWTQFVQQSRKSSLGRPPDAGNINPPRATVGRIDGAFGWGMERLHRIEPQTDPGTQ